MTEPAEPAYALLTDGTEIEIRALRPADTKAVRRMHRQMSRANLYLRFFSFSSTVADRVAEQLCRPGGPGRAALSAWLKDELVGVAVYEPTQEADVAEVALAVADDMHHRGVGTLLLEHLGSFARREGIRGFRADTLAQNHPMLRVAASAGMTVRREFDAGVVELRLSLEPGERYLDAVAERERRADVASLAHVLRPASVAVVGAGRRPGSVGHAILGSLRSGGFEGKMYAVNPHADGPLTGTPCVPSVGDLPEAPELAILAVPAPQIPETAEDCGERGVKGLVVITSGLGESQGSRLREACHRHGVRLIGPNCLGIVNTSLDLDATFAAHHAVKGSAGVVVQSGGVGIALLEQLSRLGIGISSFVSAGDKYDVSANDLLQWWESDGTTKLGILHVESFGNPRKFSRTARRVARGMPLLTVLAGRSAAGRRAAASHTAAAATPAVTQEALFSQAGVIATFSLGELVDAAALLARQPVPAGSRVAIVSNAGGAGVLAADACSDSGLTVATLMEQTQAALASILPVTAACGNPVDTTAAIDPAIYRRCVELVEADPGVDAVVSLVAPTAINTLPIQPIAGKTLAGVRLGQAENVTVGEGDVPCYAYPEDAVRAVARACSYGEWLARPLGSLPAFTDLRLASAADLIKTFLQRNPEGGWLPPRETMALLGHYGIPVSDWRWAGSAKEAVRAQKSLRKPVVLKAYVPGVIHKRAAGAVQLDLRTPGEVRQAYHWLEGRFGADLEGVLVQPMEPVGVELLCGVVQEPAFGPLVIFGLGGTQTDVIADRAARLTPLTDVDAAGMVRLPRTAALLTDQAQEALEGILLRLGRLADDHPELAELDLNPVIAEPAGPVAVDARVRVLPTRTWDPYLRRLR